MTTKEHESFVYIGLAGEGENIGPGGMYRRADGDQQWQSIAQGLPPEPQVRALLVHPENPAVIFAGTQAGPYRSDSTNGGGQSSFIGITSDFSSPPGQRP